MPLRIANNTTNAVNSRNVNTNKAYLSKLNEQMATKKKIQDPSEDPMIAMNALRYRDDLYKITQYYERNTEDAASWLKATDSAIGSIVDNLTEAKRLITTGAVSTQTNASRRAVLEQLKGISEQIKEDGNADYAGRFLFSGRRTATALTFKQTDVPIKPYTDIEETFGAGDIKSCIYVSGKIEIAGTGKSEAMSPSDEKKVQNHTLSRLRLAYDQLDNNDIQIEIKKSGITSTIAAPAMSLKDFETKMQGGGLGAAEAVFLYETGELMLGEDLARSISTSSDETEFVSVKYNKSDWKVGDLRPENYFECKSGGVLYTGAQSDISYDISAGQQTQVNMYAKDVINTGIRRDVDEMMSALDASDAVAEKISRLKEMLSDARLTTTEKENIQKSLDAALKEQALVDSKLQIMFENAETSFGDYLDKAVKAGSEVGARGQRIELVQNRLLVIETATEELADENENVELTDIGVKLKEAEVTYTAALQALGKATNLHLLNFLG